LEPIFALEGGVTIHLHMNALCRSNPGDESHFCIRVHRKLSLFQTGKVINKYIFSNRCDYIGPVSTIITVQSESVIAARRVRPQALHPI
jgi:hypothetical protein